VAKREAPGELELIEQFVNTLERETGSDQIATPSSLAEWLESRRLLAAGTRLQRADVARASHLREAMRALLLVNNGGPPAPGALDELDDAARRAGLAVRFGESGVKVVPARRGFDGGLGRLLAVVATAMTDGTWERLKACRAVDCEWVFYDHTKNHSGRWCSMEVCGNRNKVRAYRARQAA